MAIGMVATACVPVGITTAAATGSRQVAVDAAAHEPPAQQPQLAIEDLGRSMGATPTRGSYGGQHDAASNTGTGRCHF